MSTRRSFLLHSAGLVSAMNLSAAKAGDDAGPTAAAAPDKNGVLQPVALKQVALAGEFGRRVDRIIDANILKIDIDKTFLEDFRNRGTGGPTFGYVGLGKFIDAVVRLAAGTGDARLIALKKKVIAGLLATQDPDGYIGIFADPKDRMKVLWDLHESGYLIYALATDYEFFGTKTSLQGAQRLADYVLARLTANPALTADMLDEKTPFSVASIGFDRSLIVLSRVSGQRKYRDFVIDTLKIEESDPPVQAGFGTAENHAYTYMAHCQAQLDLYRETGNPQLLRPTHRALAFMREGDGMLVTGSCTHHECWHNTQLGLEMTSETCMAAYIARVMDSMLRLEGDSLYGDIMERDIYNALFAATAPDGSKSRYFTPFDGERIYDKFGYRFCCANNNKRFLAELRGWLYYRTPAGVAVNLYNASTASLDLGSGVKLRLEQQTDYPSSGGVLLKVNPSKAARFEVKLRIPRWCKTASVAVNDEAPQSVAGGRFHAVERLWKPGDTVRLEMPMEWRFVRGRRAQSGRVAVLRGPTIFTFNPERNAELSQRPGFEPRLIEIVPEKIEAVQRDESVRPGGMACTIKAWPPGMRWPGVETVPVVLTEYPDPNGRSIYFLYDEKSEAAVSGDELI